MKNKKNRRALIIIDMQKDFVLPDSPACVPGAMETIPTIKKALEAFRKNAWAVFFIVREYRENGSDIEITRVSSFLKKKQYAVPGTTGCEIVDELKPIPGEYRIVKNRFSALMNTELDFILRRLTINQIVVCGTQLPNCVRATIYDGIAHDYQVILLTDASSAQTPDIARANIHDMKNIGVECIIVDEFLKKISRDGEKIT